MSNLKRLLEDVGLDETENYFKLVEDDKKKFISVLWDEMYGKRYVKAIMNPGLITPLDVEWDIINNLNYLKALFLEQEKYEETQLIQDLLNITQDKIKKYASTTKTNRDGE